MNEARMPGPVPLMLCADDFGMTPGVTRGILDCLDADALTATDCMTNRPFWPEAARLLAPHFGRADLGVHLTLTCGAPLTAMPRLAAGGTLPGIGAILKAGLARTLPLDEIATEIAAQIDAFEQATGRMPDFIDGHQHVHAMPGVRLALREVLARRYPGTKPWLRDPADHPGAILARRGQWAKATLIALLARPFGPAMRQAGFASNHGFSGYSAFADAGDFAAEFAQFLIAPGGHHLVMCHPGHVDDALRGLDPATTSRARECAFLTGPAFPALLQAKGFRLARFQPG